MPLSTVPTCRELVDHLDQYVAGELSSVERSIIESHLHECPDCVEYLRGYVATIHLAKQSADRDPPVFSLPESLVQSILLGARK